MNPRLERIVREIKSSHRVGGPLEGAGPRATVVLQETLVARNLEDEFDEDELVEAVVALGAAPEEIDGWLEGLASWL